MICYNDKYNGDEMVNDNNNGKGDDTDNDS